MKNTFNIWVSLCDYVLYLFLMIYFFFLVLFQVGFMVCPLWWIVMAWACPWALALWYVAEITPLSRLGTQDTRATFYLSFLYMIVYWNLRFSAVIFFACVFSLIYVCCNKYCYTFVMPLNRWLFKTLPLLVIRSYTFSRNISIDMNVALSFHH